MVNEVFYRLLKARQLPIQDEQVQKILSSQSDLEQFEAMAQAFDCHLGYYNKTLYLIVNSDNDFLGFSKKKLKDRLLKSNQSVAFYYLYMFIILTLLNEFYGTSYGQGKSRSYIQLGALMNSVQENLQLGAERENTPREVPYEQMLAVYNSLKSELDHKERNSKGQLFDVVLRFLEEQDLIIRIQEDSSIRTTQRMDDLADYILRAQDGFEIMKAILEEREEAFDA